MRTPVIRLLLVIAATASAHASAATCYTVRNSNGKIIEQSTDAPVDMSQPLGQAVEEKYGPGSRLTFLQTDSFACPSTVLIEQATPRKRGEETPFHSSRIQNDPGVLAEQARQAKLDKELAAKRAEKIAQEAALKIWAPRIGMTADEVRAVTGKSDCDSLAKSIKWCERFPNINTTETAGGKTEQWVFKGAGYKNYYLNFHNDILRAIQE